MKTPERPQAEFYETRTGHVANIHNFSITVHKMASSIYSDNWYLTTGRAPIADRKDLGTEDLNQAKTKALYLVNQWVRSALDDLRTLTNDPSITRIETEQTDEQE